MNAGSLKRKATELAADDAKKPKANSSITSFFGQPKPVASAGAGKVAQTGPSAAEKFDKEEWIGKLSEEQRELLKLEIDTLHESWLPYLANEIKSKEFLDLKRFLKKEIDAGVKVFPPLEDVYSWSATFPHRTTGLRSR